MVINWNTSGMTLRFHTHPVRAGDLTNFLLRVILCCLLENYGSILFPVRALALTTSFHTLRKRWLRRLTNTRLTNSYSC